MRRWLILQLLRGADETLQSEILTALCYWLKLEVRPDVDAQLSRPRP